ncbi:MULTISPECIES: sigma-54-dependent Fis family transcriptional regulator [unclassified Novosphingobium]|uniref:sigma-54-dependent Fis family transcriptional regulator n=1 Tax=unclassified Novosphingobium TaxID=2644732 RepID=UPI000ACE22C6|nr:MULTISPECIES: sigma-54-dependent Fis family transcriptional regulator [unclassified Novosphingobium]NKI98004.1 transcriptional regulator of acetoin/glycerol metabolism [Novosphingobium sp. SG707]
MAASGVVHSGKTSLAVLEERDHVVARAWEDFVSGSGCGPKLVRDVVIESWQRCRTSQVNLGVEYAPHLATDQVPHLRQRNRQLLQAAAPTLVQAADVLAGTNSLMLITDPNGVVLEAAGDAHTVHAGMDIALMQGGRWTETDAGTNGIGTALAIGGPVMVHAGEHYCEGIKGWSCAGAPIRDPLNGDIVGILDISAKRGQSSARILALAVMTASQIEQRLTRQVEVQHLRLMEMGLEHSQRHAGDDLIAIDAFGRIVYTSRLAQKVLSEKFGTDLPDLRRGMQILDDYGKPLRHVVPGLPRDWLRPLMADGELGGHLLVIPARSQRRPLPVSPVHDVSEPVRSQFDCIVGESDCIRHSIAMARRIAPLHVPVLVEGESGVGKELFARAIHGESKVAQGPFVAFNCGAVSKELIASELFGYVRGAFTGASSDGRVGRFEEANGGTLCLDEIGELSLELQPYLLRVLEEGVVYRVGDSKPRRVNARIVAMTNRDLRAEVAAGRFRLDLFHRLSVTAVEVPPLRARAGDISRLIDYFNPRIADRHGRQPVRFTAAALARMENYSWPGNVRELRNVVERSVLFAQDDIADVDVLPREIEQHGIFHTSDLAQVPVREAVPESGEQQAIDHAIRMARGNLSAAAVTLGVSRSTLYRKMGQYGMRRISPIEIGHAFMVAGG